MICVPCFIIPVLLFIWHRFIQPILLRYWNPWEKKDAQGNVIKTEFPFQCVGGQCPFPKKTGNGSITENSETDKAITTENDVDLPSTSQKKED